MSRTKALIAIGIIMLFVGLAFSPATATSKITTNIDLSEAQLETLEKFLPELMNKMESATSYAELIDIINSYISDWGRHPFLVLLLEFIIGVINLGNNIDGIRPLMKKAFIMSWGFANKINPFKENKAQLYRPLTAWYYSGRSNLILNSRTLIIGYPFSIKTLSGRQIGFMRNFAGVYVHRETTLTDKSFTFFMGRAASVRGFDLSFLNVWNQ